MLYSGFLKKKVRVRIYFQLHCRVFINYWFRLSVHVAGINPRIHIDFLSAVCIEWWLICQTASSINLVAGNTPTSRVHDEKTFFCLVEGVDMFCCFCFCCHLLSFVFQCVSFGNCILNHHSPCQLRLLLFHVHSIVYLWYTPYCSCSCNIKTSIKYYASADTKTRPKVVSFLS